MYSENESRHTVLPKELNYASLPSVFQSAGITGRRGGLIASSVQWVLNVALTVPAIICGV